MIKIGNFEIDFFALLILAGIAYGILEFLNTHPEVLNSACK